MTYRKFLMAGVAAVVATNLGAVAWAADAAAPADTSAAASTALGEVVVTARRHEETVQNVPVAVAAFSQQSLTEKSITNAYQLNGYVPGLTVESDSANVGLPSFAIRGRGQVFGTSAGSVETYFADIPLSAPFQIPTLPAQFYDLSSFQVLKGPQGTLFGRSTTGGAVVIVPQAPGGQFGGYARIQGGTYGDFQFEGAVNIPIVEDKALLRVALFDWQRDGYMHTYAGTPNDITGVKMGSQSYDNVNTTEGRVTLLLKPFDGFTNSTLFTYHYDKTRSAAGSGLELGLVGDKVETIPERGYGTRDSGTAVDLTKPANNIFLLANTTTYDFNGDLSLKNIFGYIHSEGFTDDASDSDGLAVSGVNIDLPAVPYRPRKNEQYTDELQLQGKALDNRLTWVVGGLFDQTLEPGVNDLNITSETFLAGTGVGPGSTLVARLEQNDITSWGAYGSLTYKLTDKLNLSAGYRHSWYSIEYIAGCGTSIAPVFATQPNSGCGGSPLTYFPTINTSGDTYNAGLDYHPTNDIMIYGGYRHGYKHGGYNPSDTVISTSGFGPETVDDFFLGVKDSFSVADRPARLNIEGYYDLYTDYQAAYLGFTGGNLITTTLNIPKSTFRGFEVEAAVEATKWLTVSANYSYIDAFINRWTNTTNSDYGFGPPETVNLAVNPMAYVSPNKVSATFRLHTELSDNKGELVLQPSVNYQDRFYATAFELATPANGIATNGGSMLAAGGGIVPAYTTVDLRAEWNHPFGSRISAAVNITNLTNKLYFTGDSGTLNYGVQANGYGPPRFFTFELSTKF